MQLVHFVGFQFYVKLLRKEFTKNVFPPLEQVSCSDSCEANTHLVPSAVPGHSSLVRTVLYTSTVPPAGCILPRGLLDTHTPQGWTPLLYSASRRWGGAGMAV